MKSVGQNLMGPDYEVMFSTRTKYADFLQLRHQTRRTLFAQVDLNEFCRNMRQIFANMR